MKHVKDLTVITTLDLTQRPIQLIIRLIRLKKKIEKDFYFLIVHADRNNFYDKLVKKIFKKEKNFLSIKFKGETVCNSFLRNVGAKKIKTKYLIFCDIDIFPDINLFNKLYKKATIEDVSIAPCLYLNKKGTREIFKLKKTSKILDIYFRGDTTLIKHLAIPSSLFCISVDFFNSLLGFDEKYIGHGYEDFDFLTKIYLYKKIKIKTNFLIDKTYISPLFSIGFRAELGKLCIDNLIEENIAIHLYHKKRKKDIYYRSRKLNAMYFFKKNRENKLLNIIKSDRCKYPLLVYFYDRCKKLNKDIAKYSVLFNDNYKNN